MRLLVINRLPLLLLPLLVGWQTLAGESLETEPTELEALCIDPLTVEKNPPFIEGEHLDFKLGWSLFQVARATLECVPDDYEGKPAWKISLQARTNSFADALYKVRNLSTSWIARDVSQAFEYTAKQDEGGRKRDTRAILDGESSTGRYFNYTSEKTWDPIEILPGTFDPLGIVFFLRSIDFDVGDQIVIPTSNGKEFFFTVAHVTKKVRKKFRYGGRQEAFVVEPDIKDIGGVFKRSPDGHIRFYISADERKLPLRMESEVIVGKFWAELVDIGPPPTDDSVAVTEVK